MRRKELFRKEAIDAKRAQWYGEIVMSTPLSFKLLSIAAAALVAILVCFLTLETYTKRTTVSGQVMPSSGLIKIYTQQSGIVVEQHVTEGAQVESGDVLFELSLERNSSTRGETQASISEQARVQLQQLRERRQRLQQKEVVERIALGSRITAIRDDLRQIREAEDTQHERLDIARSVLERYTKLQAEGFITNDQLLQKRSDLLDQRARLASLERDRLATRRLLDDAENSLDISPLEYQSQLSDIDGQIARVDQELAESEAHRRLAITAAKAGVVTAIVAHVGQVVDSSMPIASLVPKGATLQVHLYARSSAIGFVRTGDTVRLRYQAFPYQHFGHYSGRVSSVSTSALSSAELTGYSTFGARDGEPLYRISVDLNSQSVSGYGRRLPLQAGMLVEADILQETRRLYQWVLQPLYSLRGKL